MIESLEEETYSMLELLKEEDSKKTRSQATKLLLEISNAIELGHEKLKQRLTLHKPSSRAYLELYHGIMQADHLFELEQRLKEKNQERIEEVQRAKRPKFPIRMSGDRYKPPKSKLSTKQLELFL